MEEKGLKSALELALDRCGAKEEASQELDPEAKEAIQRAKEEAKAKIAELEILTEQQIRELAGARTAEAYSEMEQLKSELAEKREAFSKERDAAIEAIRSGRTP